MIQGELMGTEDMPAKAEETRLPLGVARLSRMAFDGVDLNPVWHDLLRRFVYEPGDAAALMDLSVVEQIFGNRDVGIAHQARALEIQRVYPSRCSVPSPSLRVLAFAAPGDVGANAPLEFLLEGSDIELVTMYLLPGQPAEPVPEHDLAIVTIAESSEHRPQLAALRRLEREWPRPILNPPERVLNLAREHLHALLVDVPGIEMPATVRISRADLAAVANEPAILGTLLPEGTFPLIARPLDSHAGFGLTKLDAPGAIGPYLAGRPEDDFLISRFVDYRSADGFYRKYRIAFVEGRAYAVHMAIADEWAIWYLNAGMKDEAAKRAEEAHFMTDFDADFSQRHRAALGAIQERLGLDYFAIDCAETAAGNLLLFEADVAMIVHDMDDPAIYPYKRPQMRKLFAAFQGMLRKRVVSCK